MLDRLAVAIADNRSCSAFFSNENTKQAFDQQKVTHREDGRLHPLMAPPTMNCNKAQKEETHDRTHITFFVGAGNASRPA